MLLACVYFILNLFASVAFGAPCSDSSAAETVDANSGSTGTECILEKDQDDLKAKKPQSIFKKEPDDFFDSLWFAELKINDAQKSGAQSFDIKFSDRIGSGLNNDAEWDAGWALLEAVNPLPGGLKRKTPLTEEQIKQAIIQWKTKWGKTLPQQNLNNAALNGLAYLGGFLAADYDLSMKDSTGIEVLKNGGGQCTEIHSALNIVARELGFQTNLVGGVLWNQGKSGDNGGLHGLSLLEKDGKYYGLNYSQVIALPAQNKQQAIDQLTQYYGKFTQAINTTDDSGNVRQFIPNTARWAQRFMGSTTQAKKGMTFSYGSGGSGNYDLMVKPNSGDFVIASTKSGDNELQLVGFSGTKDSKSGRASKQSSYALVVSRQAVGGMNRTGVSYLLNHDQEEVIERGNGTKTALVFGSKVAIMGLRDVISGSQRSNNALPANQSYIGIERHVTSGPNGKAAFGIYEVGSITATTKGLERGFGSGGLDLSTVGKFEYLRSSSKGSERVLGGVILPNGTDAKQIFGGIETKSGNLTTQGAAWTSSGKDSFFKASGQILSAQYDAPIKSGDTNSRVGIGYSKSSGYLPFQMDRFMPSLPSNTGNQGLSVFFSYKSGRTPATANHRYGPKEISGPSEDGQELVKGNLKEDGVFVPHDRKIENRSGDQTEVRYSNEGVPTQIHFKDSDGNTVNYTVNSSGKIMSAELQSKRGPSRQWSNASGVLSEEQLLVIEGELKQKPPLRTALSPPKI